MLRIVDRFAQGSIGRTWDSSHRPVRIDAFGPLSATVGGVRVGLGPLKHRTVLAMMLCAPDRELSSDELIDVVWEGRPPASAASNLRSYIFGLRRVLGAAAITGHGSRGYRLEHSVVSTDIARFRNLCDVARRDGDVLATRTVLVEALTLRRDRPFADVAHVAAVGAVAADLDNRWLSAVEQRIQLDLDHGLAAELVPELTGLVAEHPYRERLVAYLMLALYRSRRQSEALIVYRRMTETLARDLHVAPDHRTRVLHQAILRQQPDLDVLEPARPHA